MPRVLLVDDEDSVLEVMKLLLEYEGFHVVLAISGAQALEKAKVAVPDVLVTDHMMPAMDGIELARRFKCDPALRHIPIIMVSALDATPQAWNEKLIVAYFVKPLDFSRLVSAINLVGR